jgi:hypothetical protein
VQAGELTADAATIPCVPGHRLSNGEYVPPADAATADRVADAGGDLRAGFGRACPGPRPLSLGTCAVEPLCIEREHSEHLAHVVAATHGAAGAVADAGARACQRTIASASRTLLLRTMRAHAICLDRRPRARDGARRCLGEVADGAFVEPEDRAAAGRLRAAERVLARRLRRCTPESLAALEACGRDPAVLASCLGCTLRREAMLLVQAGRGGTAQRPTTHFVDWTAIRNPVLGLEDRAIKDQALVEHDGAFFVFASQRFEASDPNPPAPVVFRTADFRAWEHLPWPWSETAEGPISAGSPDVVRIDGVWHATFQAEPPATVDPDAREIFHATSLDLLAWSPVVSLTRGLVANPIIDGALARAGDGFLLVFKDRVEQRTYVTRTPGAALDGTWLPPLRAVAGSDDPVTGFAENYQLVAIDGRQHAIATARDPEPVRCGHPIYDVYTCSHEPYLYDVPAAGPSLEGWTAWTRRRQLRVPYEAWNRFMHANTGFLSDWRSYDGFFYLSYAGSDDGDSFDLRGHGRVGLARSRDLVHWRVPGDLRD